MPRPTPAITGNGKQYRIDRIPDSSADRTLIFGTGGIGKSSLACLASVVGPVAFFDFDESLPKLKPFIEESKLDIRVVPAVETWDDLRGALHAPIWSEIKTLVIDTVTRAEELAVDWTLRNTKHEKGHFVNRLEDFGWGKGYQHVYETFLALFADLDQHVRAGRHVILVAHEMTANVPNPTGEDFLRWEPRLQHPASQKSSVKLKAKEWADHVFYVGYDIVIDEKGIALGSGTRTIYPRERPFCMAKSRTLRDPIVFDEGSHALWAALFAK